MLDRAEQRAILSLLAGVYPAAGRLSDFEDHIDRGAFQYNAAYLRDHGLVDCQVVDLLDGGVELLDLRITAKGLDFIQEDGGLGAILKTVTVRLHDDTIRQLLLDRVEKSGEPPASKERLKEAIRSAPAAALSQVLEEAVQAGLERLPDVAGTLGRWLPLG